MYLCAQHFQFVQSSKKGSYGDADAAGKIVVTPGGFAPDQVIHASEEFYVFNEGHACSV